MLEAVLLGLGPTAPLAVLELMVELGADIHYRDSEGYGPIVSATWFSPPEFVGFLLKRGANPNARFGTPPDTLLDLVYLDTYIAEDRARDTPRKPEFELQRAEIWRLDQIRRLLLAAGAKTSKELEAL